MKKGSAIDSVSIFGIRHHGPGSAACLVRALDELKPAAVLIEGPSDASAILPMLASPAMKPPVALLCYPEEDPSQASFWPFAEFSPEYQATLWAVAAGVPVEFIDLPSTVREIAKNPVTPDLDAASPDGTGESESEDTAEPTGLQTDADIRDPIGELAAAAGYEDGESWWSDMVEENPSPGPIFEAIAEAMVALRSESGRLSSYNAKREAHMRLSIAAARKAHTGQLAVVCGAWHVPALGESRPQKEDRALIKGLPRRKSNVTWAPWTMPRLAFGYGYGAGVAAPGWCDHVWRTRTTGDTASRWLVRIAHHLRDKGHAVSTASLIEAERTARALAAIRDRPGPGFEELREASVACLFGGEVLLWKSIEAGVLLGNEVGEIPPEAPHAPLLDDLQRCQKAARLKPEALEREIAIDLRSDAGLYRSVLLHRLGVLGVHWGTLQDKGGSRGTFRERWTLAWQPEYAVGLVEKLVYGATIEHAATAYLIEQIGETKALDGLASLIRLAIVADLPSAASQGLEEFEENAAHSTNSSEMLAAIPPLTDIVRYGEARASDAGLLRGLLERLVVESAINLVYAARNLDHDAAVGLSQRIVAAHAGIRLVEPPKDTIAAWQHGLEQVLDDSQATPHIAGCCAQILYEADAIAADEAVILLERRLSPGTAVMDAAGFLEGFFSESAARMIHDEGLRCRQCMAESN